MVILVMLIMSSTWHGPPRTWCVALQDFDNDGGDADADDGGDGDEDHKDDVHQAWSAKNFV